MKKRNTLIAALVVLILLPVLMYVLNPFGTATRDPRARVLGFTLYRIPSGAMSPTLVSGDYILVSSAAYAFSEPQRGDVIVFRYPNDRNVAFVFRLIARGGERVKIEQGITYINGQPLEEPYLASPGQFPHSQTLAEFQVGENELFVLGDNRDNSHDSRFWGTVPRDDLIGKVFYIWLSEQSERVGVVH